MGCSFLCLLADKVHHLAISHGLQALKPAPMDASNRTECLHNTRSGILSFITGWMIQPSEGQNILWLHGVAGCGKSTIANTIAVKFQACKMLGAFLFFDRSAK